MGPQCSGPVAQCILSLLLGHLPDEWVHQAWQSENKSLVPGQDTPKQVVIFLFLKMYLGPGAIA